MPADSEEGGRARMVGINHVAIEVGDVEAALDFLGRIFEIRLRGRGEGRAFVDMGDQFLALSEPGPVETDTHRHFGLVVDDREAVMAAADQLGAAVGRNRFRDPWGNIFEIVAYSDVQFSKTGAVLEGMGLDLDKGEDARRQLREKGLG
ncbi:VOC family protein [Rhodosalinus halophilus]|uniref:VOC family protein n=1 Tax=Rhodosalinus halophilus TaxID=2259333 RepID=A0A365UD27_9RHOB|nr:VOC family protein [Rhodosalinus halophilus]RBI87456.1 VOC family protein [Rhodosalinus halophilus]